MTLRVMQLLIGLVLFGAGCAVMVQAGIGLDPWTVFAQGLSKQTGIGIGWVTNVLGFLVLLLWIPLRQRPGLGTVLNILLVGTAMQGTLMIVPEAASLVASWPWWAAFAIELVMFLVGVGMVAVASGLYIGARFGPGPRDGLMTGINERFGWPIWAARLGVELAVLLAGWLLGGTVGLGTVLFAVLIGPLVHRALVLFDHRARGARRARVADRPNVATHAGR